MIEAIRAGGMGKGMARGERKKVRRWMEFRGEEKNWKEKEGGGRKKESAKIYVHARVRGYRGSAGGGWNRRGKQAYIASRV